MPSPESLQQGLDLFRSLWTHRFPDQESYDRLLAAYALGCEDLSDIEWFRACKAAVKASDHLPTPAELNRWIKPPRDPETEYQPVNPYQAPPTHLLPPASPQTQAARQAEWDRMKAELREKWRAMDEERRRNPRPGPGYDELRRQDRERRRKMDTYAEKGEALELLLDVKGGMAAGAEEWIRRRVSIEQSGGQG